MFEERDETFDLADGVFVGVSGAGGVVDHGVDQHGYGLRDAVEHEQLIRDDEIHRGRSEFVMRRARNNGFDIVDKFVTDETHRAASEARQPRQRDGPILLHNALDDFESVLHAIFTRLFARRWYAELLHHLAVLGDFNLAAGLLDDRTRIAADERIATEMFAAFHGLKEKRFALPTDFAIGRERRFDVSENARGDGDQVAPSCQFQKVIKRR